MNESPENVIDDLRELIAKYKKQKLSPDEIQSLASLLSKYMFDDTSDAQGKGAALLLLGTLTAMHDIHPS